MLSVVRCSIFVSATKNRTICSSSVLTELSINAQDEMARRTQIRISNGHSGVLCHQRRELLGAAKHESLPFNSLGLRLENKIERCFGGPPKVFEPSGSDNLAQSGFTRLRSERKPYFL